MVRFFVEIKFYSFAIFLSNQLWILIFLNEMSTRPRFLASLLMKIVFLTIVKDIDL